MSTPSTPGTPESTGPSSSRTGAERLAAVQESVQDAVKGAARNAQGAARDAQDSLQDAAGAVQDLAQDVADSVLEEVRDALGDPELVVAIADAVEALDAVDRLHGGVLGEIATHLPGRRVTGVRVGRDEDAPRVEVHVVLGWGAELGATGSAIRGAVRAVPDIDPSTRVDVVVEDVAGPAREPVMAGSSESSEQSPA